MNVSAHEKVCILKWSVNFDSSFLYKKSKIMISKMHFLFTINK